FLFLSPSTSSVCPLSLHDALPISFAVGMSDVLERSPASRVLVDHNLVLGDDLECRGIEAHPAGNDRFDAELAMTAAARLQGEVQDRKSTRLNSSHQIISYAVFCLK